MRKIFIFSAGILFMLMAACTQDNSSVVQIAEIVNEAAAQRQALRDSTVTFEEIVDHLFITPDGNIFANEKIYAIIEANPDYQLTKEDKKMLTDAVIKFRGENKPDKNDTQGMNDYIISSNAETAIETSKTLKDLFAHGSAL